MVHWNDFVQITATLNDIAIISLFRADPSIIQFSFKKLVFPEIKVNILKSKSPNSGQW